MTNEEAIQYLKDINFCTGCPIDMSIDNGKSCNVCEHRAFFEMAIAALEKQIAKQVEVYSDGDADGYPVLEEHCPSCGYDFDGTTPNFCPDCGQRLLFEEESE